MARSEMAGFPDLVAMRKQYSGQPGAELLEAQLALTLAAREETAGLRLAALGAATRELTPKSLLTLRAERLAAGKGSRLLLAPRR
jgi:hypothetical protein